MGSLQPGLPSPSAIPSHFHLIVIDLKNVFSLVLGKTPLTKKAHEETHVHRAKFNGRPTLPGWPGKRWRSLSLGEQWLL
jgi:hypothetical protein